MDIRRMTIKNSNDTGYRAPLRNHEKIRIDHNEEIITVFGDVIDRLGKYEDLGTLEDFAALKERGSGIKR